MSDEIVRLSQLYACTNVFGVNCKNYKKKIYMHTHANVVLSPYTFWLLVTNITTSVREIKLLALNGNENARTHYHNNTSTATASRVQRTFTRISRVLHVLASNNIS